MVQVGQQVEEFPEFESGPFFHAKHCAPFQWRNHQQPEASEAMERK